MQNLSDTRVPVGTTEQIRYGQNLIKCRSTRRYYRTYQIQDKTYSDTGLIRYRSTRRYYRTYTETELIRYRSTRRYYRTYSGSGLIRYKSTRRYYRTYSDTGLVRYRSTRRYYRTDQIQDLSDTGVIRNGTYSETGVPVGTTDLIQRQAYQIQEYQ